MYNTPAKDKGIVVGQVVRLTKDYATSWKAGDLVRMTIDDNTNEPRFEHCVHGRGRYIGLQHIEVIAPAPVAVPPAPPVASGFRFDVGDSLLQSLLSMSSPARMITIEGQEAQTTEENAMQYTTLQKQALDCFVTMYNRAEQVRNGDSISDSLFYVGYGICDNIGRTKPTGASTDTLSTVKDNLIRRTPSYSGNYHYPVSCPDNPGDIDAADSAWGNHNNKWTGAYGANRLKQLAELIELVKTVWDDKLGQDQTPAARVGLIEGVSIVQWRRDLEHMYRFVADDRSSDPYFERLDGGDRRSIDLRYITILPMPSVENDSRSVAEFLEAIKAEQDQAKAITAQIEALKKALSDTSTAIAMLDYGLRTVHKVQRLDK